MKIITLSIVSLCLALSVCAENKDAGAKSTTESTANQPNSRSLDNSRVTLYNAPNKELLILLNVDEQTNRFTDYFSFQYKDYDMSSVLAENDLTLSSYNKDKVVLLAASGKTYEFSIDHKSGFGLSKNWGSYKYLNPQGTVSSMFEVFEMYDKNGNIIK